MTSGGDHSDEQQEQAEAEIHLRTPATTDSDQAAQAAPSTNYETPFSHLEVGHAHGQIAYLNIDPYYGGIYAPYGGQPMMHPQLVGVQQTGMSLPIDAVEEPIHVNAKQYNAILRRRQSRAKAESENRHFKRRKPYLHESRHQHALRRVRGSGGRFLNRKPNDYMEESSSSTSSDEENGVEPGNDREPSTSSPSNGASFAK